MARRARPLSGVGPRLLTGLLTTVAVLLLAGCGGAGDPAPYDATGVDGLEIPTPSPDPADFVARVDNPWLPLRSGDSWRYVVADGGREVGEVRVDVLRRTAVSGVQATAVQTSTTLTGAEPTSVTRYYAQDDAGNVWLLGEDADGVRWRAGEAGAEAGLAMPAEPRVGDGWLRAEVPGLGTQTLRVDGLDGDVLRMVGEDATGAATSDEYESGVGLVGSAELDGDRSITLVR